MSELTQVCYSLIKGARRRDLEQALKSVHCLQPSAPPISRSRGYSILQLVSVNHFRHTFYTRRDGKFLFMAEYSIKEKTNFTLIQLTRESYLLFQATIVLMTRNAHIWGDTLCLAGTYFNGSYGEAPAERSTFFRLQVYEKCNSHSTYQPLIPRTFNRRQGKPWSRLITFSIQSTPSKTDTFGTGSKCPS